MNRFPPIASKTSAPFQVRSPSLPNLPFVRSVTALVFSLLFRGEAAAETRWVERDRILPAFRDTNFTVLHDRYWKEISALDREPTILEIPRDESHPHPKEEARVLRDLRGATWFAEKPEPHFPDHVLEVRWGDRAAQLESWDGTGHHRIDLGEIDFSGEMSKLSLRIPPRTTPDGQFVADIVYLDRIGIGDPPQAVDDSNGFPMGRLLPVTPPEGGADYLIICPHVFVETLTPLAEAHRERGLRVAFLVLEDLVPPGERTPASPQEIRGILREARDIWAKPPPRFVLLAGDASRDSEDIVKNRVPTWHLALKGAVLATDNPYACLEGDGALPEIAIGRFPASNQEALATMVEKTLASLGSTAAAPRNRRALWITNEEPLFQTLTRDLGKAMEPRGLQSTYLFPNVGGEGAGNVTRLSEALTRGYSFAAFYGHGSRDVWRLGARDLAKQSNLFTSDHIDQLPPGSIVPVVLSFTCDSAPFDNPIYDSIGERFVTVPGRGSVAFIGASWRTNSNIGVNRAFIDAVTTWATIGEAFLHAKREGFGQGGEPLPRHFRESYQLLGDPALALPPTINR